MGIVEQKLGELLKLERERRQLSLADISTDTKIPEENLEGIENGDMSLVPSPVYFTLFTRTYCQALGIDYNRTADAIREELGLDQKRGENSKTGQKAEELNPPPKSSVSRLRPNTMLKKVFGIGAGLVIVFLGYLLVDSAFLSNGLDKNGASEMLKGVNAERLNAVTGFDWNTPEYSLAAEIKIELKPRGESWTTVMADGDTVIFRSLTPGKDYKASAKHRLIVSVGVPEAVDILINGQLVDLRDPVNQRISRIEVNQANLESYLNPTSENMPNSDTGQLLQGQLELGKTTQVTVTEGPKNPTDSSKKNLEKDES